MKKLIVLLIVMFSLVSVKAQSYFAVGSGFGISKRVGLGIRGLQSQNGHNYTIPLGFEYYSKKGFKFSVEGQYMQAYNSYEFTNFIPPNYTETFATYQESKSESIKIGAIVGYNIYKKRSPFQLFVFAGYLHEKLFSQSLKRYDYNKQNLISNSKTKTDYTYENLILGIEARYVFKRFYTGASFFIEDDVDRPPSYLDYPNRGWQIKLGYIISKK